MQTASQIARRNAVTLYRVRAILADLGDGPVGEMGGEPAYSEATAADVVRRLIRDAGRESAPLDASSRVKSETSYRVPRQRKRK